MNMELVQCCKLNDGRIYRCRLKPLHSDYLNWRENFMNQRISDHESVDLLQNKSYMNIVSQSGCYAKIISQFNLQSASNGINTLEEKVLMSTICALEDFDAYAWLKIKFKPNALMTLTFGISLIVIDNMLEPHRKQHSELIMRLFIEIYVLITIHKIDYGGNKWCTNCNKNNYDECLTINCLAQSHLGYLMVFASKRLYKGLQSISLKELTDSLLNCYKLQFRSVICSEIQQQLRRKAKLLKIWNANDIAINGGKYVFDAFDLFCRMESMYAFDSLSDYGLTESKLFHITGKVYSLFDREHDTANCYLVIAICSEQDLYQRILSLKALMFNCYLNEQYLIGIKILKYIFKICAGYILSSFVKRDYFKQKKKFKTKIAAMKCSNCNREKVKLRACSGCMKMAYCSAFCQKRNWNRTHRNQCNKTRLYWMLKTVIFDNMFRDKPYCDEMFKFQ
eukprot:160043_1